MPGNKPPTKTPDAEASVVTLMTVCQAGAAPHYKDPDECGLLFVHLEQKITDAEAVRIMTHPDVRAHLKDFYYGTFITETKEKWWTHNDEHVSAPARFFVSAETAYLPSAKTAQIAPQVPLYVMHRGCVYRTTYEDLYLACHQLIKLISCQKCSMFGQETCLTQSYPKDALLLWKEECPQLDLPFVTRSPEEFRVAPEDLKGVFDYADWKALRYTPWKSQVAGYTYVSPLATAYSATTPGTRSIRPPAEHFFQQARDNSEELSSRSKAGVETRHRKNTECRKCYFGGEHHWGLGKGNGTVAPCTEYNPRFCAHNAWTLEEVIETTLTVLRRSCEETVWDLEGIWRVAQIAGVRFKKKNEHTGRMREWVISGMSTSFRSSGSGEVRVTVKRTARNARDSDETFTTLSSLWDFLPDEVKLHSDGKKPIDREQLALWAHHAAMQTGKEYSFFYSTASACGYGHCAPAVGSTGLSARGGIDVELWLSREERHLHFSDFSELFAHYEYLPLFSITDENLPEHARWHPRWGR